MNRVINVPEVVIDGALPRTPLERIHRIADFAADDTTTKVARKIARLVSEAEDADEEFLSEVEDDLIEAINEQYDGAALLISGIDPGDVVLCPTNDDGLPVDEDGELWPE